MDQPSKSLGSEAGERSKTGAERVARMESLEASSWVQPSMGTDGRIMCETSSNGSTRSA